MSSDSFIDTFEKINFRFGWKEGKVSKEINSHDLSIFDHDIIYDVKNELYILNMLCLDSPSRQNLEEEIKKIRELNLLKCKTIQHFECLFVENDVLICLSSSFYVQSLHTMMSSRDCGININGVCYIISQIANALYYLLKNHIVLLNLSLKTIMISNSCELTITGFKNSKKIPDPYKLYNRPYDWALHTFPVNSEYYTSWVAPEIISQNLIGYDYKSDVFSLGILSIELYLGCDPFMTTNPLNAYVKKCGASLQLKSNPITSLDERKISHPLKFIENCKSRKKLNKFRNIIKKMVKFNPIKRPLPNKIFDKSFIKKSRKPTRISQFFEIE